MLAELLLVCKALGLSFRQIYTYLSQALSPRLHRLTYRSVEHPRNVVVIGASFAGYHAARCLASSLPTGYRVVIVEKNTHLQVTWVLPRFSVVGGHEHKAFIPYGPYLSAVPKGSYEWVRDTAEQISVDEDGGGNVQLGSGTTIDFEYLVMATGASGSLPSRVGVTTKKEGMEMLSIEQDKLVAATDVVVLGGGPAGIELAGDAKSRYPEKNVTLVHSRKALLNDHFGPTLAKRALEELEKIGVSVKLGERVNVDGAVETGTVQLHSGETIPCSYLAKCIGQRPNSALIQALSPKSVSSSGHIRVRPTLQLADSTFDRIYAAGDVIELNCIRNARSAFEQARFVANNIVCSIRSKKQAEYRYGWWEGATKLTLGLTKAVAYMSDGTTEISMSMKSKEDIDSTMIWRFFGAKAFVDETNGELD
ncbi:putative mercuric reductase [Aspergillus steynii IBT 23096]|uniref:Putative mercuric reductase n=1 Tax=Aspergillus steynii IBT 23096 TaxID=1392250 RepID=A0A2I2GH38_9EURO|nr:putative mercuric reductase [Aspergillus steynii IBT 23096]PLB52193.1 putative mercuric reductase [Aspergillus steynii IBT 23096]